MFFKKQKTTELILFMKSGRSISVSDVVEWKMSYDVDNITYLRIEQTPKARRKLLVPTVCLSQIEAVMEIK